jgi:hypothetical protein
MVKMQKKQGFALPLERLYTGEKFDAFEMIHFRTAEEDEDASPTLECPENWSPEAASILAEEAASQSIPAETKPIEENTTPSWLWRHVDEGKAHLPENSVKQIFHRAVGVATYAGWKLGVFGDEGEARIFFDEMRYMLAQRFIAIDPRDLATRGLDWGYGVTQKPVKAALPTPRRVLTAQGSGSKSASAMRNTTIDAILSGRDKNTQRKWRHFLAGGIKHGTVELRFTDIAGDWNMPLPTRAPRAMLDVMAFRREDGGIDVDRMCHAVRLLVTFFDLESSPNDIGGIAIGFANLASLLLSLGLPYDSDAGRMTAAALAAIVTAEAYAVSAQLAAQMGPSSVFMAYRDSTLRALRNHRRAAYGDRNDYEKISVLPVPLSIETRAIETGADLALIATARRRWDDALDLARTHGLRHVQVTELFASPSLAIFMESTSQGSEPLRSLIDLRATEAGTFRRLLNPSVDKALSRLGYDEDSRNAITQHIIGTGTLAKAPGIDHAALRARGFDDAAIARGENYLAYANDIRTAFTPWVVGEEFCRTVLKISAVKLQNPKFDLLRHLGFSAEAIHSANAFCFGHGSARSAPRLKLEHLAVFAQAHEISAAAQIRLATSMQSFIAGDADLHLLRPAGLTVEECEKLALNAWRQGAKSITINIEPAAGARAVAGIGLAARLKASSKAAPKAPIAPVTGAGHLRSALKGRTKASGKLVGFKRAEAKLSPKGKRD